MQLSVSSLKETGGFVGAPVEREVTWNMEGQDYTATVHVRPLSYKSAVAELTAIAGNSDAIAHRIASCICDAEGNPVFTPEDITGEADPERGALHHNLTMALLAVIAEVSGLGKPKKTSAEKTSSGANSSSTESEEGQSKKLSDE